MTASADAWIEQNSPQNNKGTDSILKVKSQARSDNFRALVGFQLPPTPAGCTIVSASLRIFADSSQPQRTLEARRTLSPWTEHGVTWANQPATELTPATVVTTSVRGYRSWSITQQARDASASGGALGFVVQDALEESTGVEQSFFSREKGESPPQVVIVYG